ncbi:MAG: hypothetical protein N0E54_13710 [Candidatus Thiodiazotropha taylori]|nr:hypothetical protein [Candidatus Thiodiazotropha endolucinida]MCW4229789.1 hypothetical protein [Candidatus Thiodiazotropha taylori]
MRLKDPGKGKKGKRLKPHEVSSSKVNYDLEAPVFSLQNIQKSHCLSKCERNEKAAFADTMHQLSSLLWRDIKRSGRHHLGYEKINRDSLKKPVPENVPEDANVIAFRFCDKAPMVGYRDKATFHVIWLDRDFSLYNH